ncbi:MAG: hypothetical protein PHQ40_20370 [Anaerolineaceae bacterium]|nr:hypothetical protein [Anaerolineaceae bacterium]
MHGRYPGEPACRRIARHRAGAGPRGTRPTRPAPRLASQRLPLAFESSSLRDQPQALEAALRQAIAELQPDLVFTHSLHDQNTDHRAVHHRRAILCYEGHTPTADFFPASTAAWLSSSPYCLITLPAL